MPGARLLNGDQRAALDKVRLCTAARAEATAAWERAIVDAHYAGCSYRAIEDMAGVTYERARQIVRKHNTD